MNLDLNVKSLACMQIVQLVETGRYINERELNAIKSEWFRRWRQDYPYYRATNGQIKVYGE